MDKRGTATIGGLLKTIGERWPVVLISLLVGLGVGYLSSLQVTTPYAASSLVQVYSDTSRPPDMRTEQIIAQSASVASLVAEELGDGTTVAEVQESTTVGNPQGALVLTFSSRATARSRATQIANAYAQSYLDQRQELMVAAGSAEDVIPGAVIDRATPTGSSEGVSPGIVVVAAGALAALIGIGVAILIDLWDPRVRNPRRLQRLFYDDILPSGDPADAARIATALARRLAPDRNPQRIAILGTDKAAAARLLPKFSQQVDRETGGLAGSPPEIVNATVLPTLQRQVAAAADCDLTLVVATPRDSRKDIQLLADSAALVSGKPSLGWFLNLPRGDKHREKNRRDAAGSRKKESSTQGVDLAERVVVRK